MTALATAEALQRFTSAAQDYAREHDVDPDDDAAIDEVTKAVMTLTSKEDIELVARHQLELEIRRVFDEDVAAGRLLYDPVEDTYRLASP